jgi:Modifier of rudimentary (Mod(r)) protein
VTGDTLILRVHWPATVSGMIARPPAMTLAGVEARHPWLDSRMRIVGYGPIQTSDAWLTANILLGAAVHAVVTHLQLNPPTILQFVDSGLSAIQTKKQQTQPAQYPQQSSTAMNGSHNSSPPPPAYHDSIIQASVVKQGNPSHTFHPNTQSNIDWPTISPQFKEVDALSRERLERVIQNDLEFKSFTNQLDIMQQYNTIQQEQLNKNVSTAKANLRYEDEIQELHLNITKLQTELQTKVKAFQALEQQQDTVVHPPPVDKVIRELTKAKKEAYTQSEQIVEEWLQSNTNNHDAQSVQRFIDEFMSVRKVQHVRAAKLEILERTSRTGTN